MQNLESTQSKSIVFTSNSSFSLINFRLGLMDKLKELGYSIVAIAPEDDFTARLRERYVFFPLKNLERKGKNPFKDLQLLREYISYLSRLKPSLVISYTIKPNIYSSLACRFLKIPNISVVTGLGYVYQKGGLMRFLVNFLYKVSTSFSNKIVFMNPDDLKELKGVLPKDKLTLIRSSGVNSSFFSPHNCQEYLKNKPKKTVFLFLGRFLRDKGIFELIEAGKMLRNDRDDFEIWLVGSIDRGNPESLKNHEIDTIKRFDYVRVFPFAYDVRQFLCLADVVVHPSYYREGIPRVLLEAMAMEKPIITTDTPGCRETVIEGINGFLVKPKDVESLFKIMEKFMDFTEDKRKDMGKRGREFVIENFDESLVISKYVELIESIVKH